MSGCFLIRLIGKLRYPHSPLGSAHPRDCASISIKPLAAMLQPINVQVEGSYTSVLSTLVFGLYNEHLRWQIFALVT